MSNFIATKRAAAALSALVIALASPFAAFAAPNTSIGTNITTTGTLTVGGNSTFDTNTLFVDSAGNRVGIGTVAPSTALEVTGAVTATEFVGGGSGLTGLTKAQVGLGNVDDLQQLPLSYLDTDGTLAANSDVKVASQKATKTYVDSLGDLKLNLSGGTMTGDIDMDGNDLLNVSSLNGLGSAVLGYLSGATSNIQTQLGAKADKVVAAVSGNLAALDGSGNLTDSGLSAASTLSSTGDGSGLTGITKAQVGLGNVTNTAQLSLTGGTMSGAIAMGGNNISGGGTVTATTFVGALTGNAATATALSANGANCGAGLAPLGVDASGAAEGCTAYLGATAAAGGELSGNYPNPTLSNSAVIGKLLTGYVSGAGTVAATDSLLAAIQKLNGNDGLKLNLSGGTLSGALAMGGNDISGGGTISATTFSGAFSGNATTATQLAANPADCGSDLYATAIDAGGNLTCATVTDASLSANVSLLGSSISSSEITDDTVTSADLASALTFADGDILDLSAINASSNSEGLRLPQNAAGCSASTSDGSACWDSTANILYVGDGSAALAVGNPFGVSIDSSEITNGTVVNADLAGGTYAGITGLGTLGGLTMGGAVDLATNNVTNGGTVTAASFVGPLTGNASTAAALQTARTINGVSFDGTANITIPKGLDAYAMFYGLTAGTGNFAATDYAATVAVGAAVPFPRDGASLGITRASASTFTVSETGTYEVSFHVQTTEPGQLKLQVNGTDEHSCVAANMIPTAGGHPIDGNCIVVLSAGDVIAIVNPVGNVAALTITPADGAQTHANSQTLTIKKL